MADSLFEIACTELERASGLGRLAARGTLRLALKQAGLEPETLTLDQLDVVVKRVLPQELKARGIADPAAACASLARQLAAASPAHAAPVAAPEDLFRRLRGS